MAKSLPEAHRFLQANNIKILLEIQLSELFSPPHTPRHLLRVSLLLYSAMCLRISPLVKIRTHLHTTSCAIPQQPRRCTKQFHSPLLKPYPFNISTLYPQAHVHPDKKHSTVFQLPAYSDTQAKLAHPRVQLPSHSFMSTCRPFLLEMLSQRRKAQHTQTLRS
ncbi:hypothetical protein TRVL_08702 [Trypanosoma vivax]|nr:hypothetical protein TRVL_08702 [Trypanosoma vivax]